MRVPALQQLTTITASWLLLAVMATLVVVCGALLFMLIAGQRAALFGVRLPSGILPAPVRHTTGDGTAARDALQ